MKLKVISVLISLFIATSAYSAIDLDGSNDYVDLGAMGNFGSELDTFDTTISFWIKSTDTTRSAIFGSGNNTGNDTVIFAQMNVDRNFATNVGGWMERLRDEGNRLAQGGCNGDQGWTDGEWHHMIAVMRRDGSAATLRIDGINCSFTTQATLSQNNTANFTGGFDIGGMNWKGSHCQDGCFNGIITEFYIWQTALTTDETDRLFHSQIKGMGRQIQPKSLYTYLPLDDVADGLNGSGRTFRDHNENANDGTGAGGSSLVGVAEQHLSY